MLPLLWKYCNVYSLVPRFFEKIQLRRTVLSEIRSKVLSNTALQTIPGHIHRLTIKVFVSSMITSGQDLPVFHDVTALYVTNKF